MGLINNIVNKFNNIYWVPTDTVPQTPVDSPITQAYARNFGGSEDITHNLNIFRAPIDVPRMKQDMSNWRYAISEAERQIYPYRYIMQQMYMDTMLDPHIVSCWNRRLELSLLKKFKIKNRKSGEEYVEWTNFFKKSFFPLFIKYVLEAKLYGYTLLSMGDIFDDEFVNLSIIRRTNINPDTHLMTAVPRTTNGIDFRDDPYRDWMIWVPTPNDHAQSNCGYGLLYILSPLAIRLKNNMTYNCDYNMKFGMPFRFFKTKDKNETEKQKKQKYLENMGDSGWMIADEDDSLEFIQGNQGKGFAAFEDLERRLQQTVSKLILGHADALDSVTGKLGSSQGTKGIAGSPQEQALNDISSSDGEFLKHIIEEQLFRIIRVHNLKSEGISLPIDAEFVWDNDKEKAEHDSFRNDENLKMIQIMTGLKNNGYKIKFDTLKDLMELELEEVEIEEVKEPKENEINNYFNAAPKGSGHTDESWERLMREREALREEQRINREYREKTKGWDGKKRGLNKEQYQEFVEGVKEDIDGKTLEDGPIHLHINCGCELVDGKWELGPNDNHCQDCIDSQTEYNNETDTEIKNSIYTSHRGKYL